MIPVNTPLLSGNEGKYLQECISTQWISSEGPFVKRFEKEFAAYNDRKYGIAVANGSAALDIAVRALDLPKGSEVIMPTFTIISPAASLIHSDLKPVLVDSKPDTWNMDVSQIEAKITDKTSAILVVHIYGLPVEMDEIIALAKKYNLKIIEDAAEMHGQEYNLCFKKGQRYVHDELGWNYRMTNLQAALGVAQLEKIDTHIEKKRAIGRLYNELFQPVQDQIQLPLAETNYAENIYWVYGLVANSTEQRDRLIKHLGAQKIGTRTFFWCMHEQPVFKKMGLFEGERYPVAEKLARNGLYIPAGLGIQEEEIKTVAKEMIGELKGMKNPA